MTPDEFLSVVELEHLSGFFKAEGSDVIYVYDKYNCSTLYTFESELVRDIAFAKLSEMVGRPLH